MSGADLQGLLAVQDLDLAAGQLRHRRDHLAERAELTGIEAESAAARAEHTELDATLSSLDDRQAGAEADLAAAEERAATINRRLFGGEVTASRDLQAMSAELEQLKARTSALEDAVLAIMEEREPLEARVGEIDARLEQLAVARSEAETRLAGAEQTIGAELDDVRSRRVAAASSVPEGLMATYDKLRARLGGVGVARLVGNHCDGCHLTLPAAELDRVRHLPEGEVYQCEQCSRILVP